MNNLLTAFQKNCEAYLEIKKTGLIKDVIIQRHIEQQLVIDEFLPDPASFFYVTELPTYKYHFMGKQQKNVSGYTNEEFQERGVELFIESVHPDDVDILFNQVYATYIRLMVELPPEDRRKLQFQYNYRFKRKDGEMLNLLEQMYALECDDSGIPVLILGNVIIIGNNEQLPVRATGKLIIESGFSDVIFSQTYGPISNKVSELTNRELDILRNLALGKKSKQIADELFISPHTVDTHRRNLLSKLECHSVVELARIAYKNGLL